MTVQFGNYTRDPGFTEDFHKVRDFLVRINRKNPIYALVEPVATDPDYRRLGLGRAVVLEGIKRCGELGANQAYVGSSQPFYYQPCAISARLNFNPSRKPSSPGRENSAK